jgi:ATP-binding cassette, subfamily B, bacterial PglK
MSIIRVNYQAIIFFLQQIRRLLGDQVFKVPILGVMFLLSSFTEMLSLGVIASFVGVITKPELAMDIPMIEWVEYLSIPLEPKPIQEFLGFFLVFIFFVKGCFAIVINVAIVHFSREQKNSLTSRLLHAYQYMPYEEYIRRNSSEYIQSISGHVGAFTGTVSSLLKLFNEIIILLSIVIILGILNIHAVLLLSGLLLFFSLIHVRFVQVPLKKMGEEMSILSQKSWKTMQEGLGGLKEVRILGNEAYFVKIFKELIIKHSKISVKVQALNIAPRYVLELIIVSFIVMLALISLNQGQNINSLLPILSVFVVACLRLIPSANVILQSLAQVRVGQFGVHNLWKDLQYVESLEQLPLDTSKNLTNEPFKTLEVHDVFFRYHNVKKFALTQINLKINQGEAIGLIGTSGGGKTTLFDILLGLLEPQKGSLFFNQQLLKKDNWNRLRSQVAYLPQQVYLIDDTLRRNIAFGMSDEEINEDLLLNAIRQARLEELVKELPQGVNTLVGERGIRLSGGQRQRVALAKAFYYNRQILIMDESTSALDNETEKKIIEEMQMLKRKVTLVIIAHRLTTVQFCDRIYRLDAGKIEVVGTYDQVVGKASTASR